MQFAYQARDITGHVHDGEITAADVHEATRQLRQEGMYLLALREKGAAAIGFDLALFQKRVSRSDIVYLTNQLAVMVDSGIPVASALDGLAKNSDNPTLKKVLDKIQRSVEGGEDFSAALARFPKYFDKTYVNLVKASEASGTLGTMLERVAIQLRAEVEMRQKVRGALTYPAAMVVMCVGVSIFLLTYVFPKLTPMFASRSIEIPVPTKIMIAISGALTGYWYFIVAGLAVLIGAAIYTRKQPWARSTLDWCRLYAPIIGPLMRKVALSRSLRTLATTINAGVPALESIELCAGVARNVHFERSWLDASREVASGRQIHDALEGNPLFPPTLIQMIASGETTGKLGQVLARVSDYFDREVEGSIKTTTSLIEPIMVFVMGGVIGTIALAMLLPIFKLSSHVG